MSRLIRRYTGTGKHRSGLPVRGTLDMLAQRTLVCRIDGLTRCGHNLAHGKG